MSRFFFCDKSLLVNTISGVIYQMRNAEKI